MTAETEFWNLKAARYPRPFAPANLPETLAVIDKVKACGVGISGRDVLDIGCGTGNYGLVMAREARSVLCLDFSEEMLSALRGEARAAGLTNVEAQLASFPDYDPAPRRGAFDLVFASMTPAVRTEADVRKMEALCRGWCVYIGWAGRRENPLADAILGAHGVAPAAPPGFPRVMDILGRNGRKFTAQTFETSWTWKGTREEALADFSARIRLDSREPDRDLIARLLGEAFPGGEVSLTTHATEGMLVWRP